MGEAALKPPVKDGGGRRSAPVVDGKNSVLRPRGNPFPVVSASIAIVHNGEGVRLTSILTPDFHRKPAERRPNLLQGTDYATTSRPTSRHEHAYEATYGFAYCVHGATYCTYEKS